MSGIAFTGIGMVLASAGLAEGLSKWRPRTDTAERMRGGLAIAMIGMFAVGVVCLIADFLL